MAKQLLEFVVSAILLSNCAWSVASCAGSATEVSCVEGAAALACAGDAQAGSTGAGNGMEVGTGSGDRGGIDCDSLLGILGYYNRIPSAISADVFSMHRRAVWTNLHGCVPEYIWPRNFHIRNISTRRRIISN